jgi:hypothetical protein
MTYRTKQGQVVPKAQPCSMADYRFGFERLTGKWWVTPAKRKTGQVIVAEEAPKLCEVDVQCHPDGTMTCTAELVVDGSTVVPNSPSAACRSFTLRLMRVYDVSIHMDAVGLGTRTG